MKSRRFSRIASRPGQSFEHIRNVLIAPHGAMPNVSLSVVEIEAIVAYLDTLRGDGTTPLLPRDLGKVPALPRSG